jgi:hypothetical protein
VATRLPEQIPIASWPALRRTGWHLADDSHGISRFMTLRHAASGYPA